MKITDIRLNSENPRYIKDDRMEKLVQSIKDFPAMMTLRPIVVDENNVILGGNMRYRALLELKYETLPAAWVKKAKDLTEEQKKEFIIKDNINFGMWDMETLANEWPDVNLDEWGLDIDWDIPTDEAEEDNYEIPEKIETDIVLGDLYQIGEHRLLCGDSTDLAQVEKLMGGEKSELLFTSPPYSDMREYNGNKDLSVVNLIEFIPTFLPYAEYQVINLGIQRKEFEIVEYWQDYINKAKDCGYKFLSWNVWNRDEPRTISQQQSFIPIAHEWLFVFGKKNKEINKTVECKMAGEVTTGGIRSTVKGDNNKLNIREYEIGSHKKINSVSIMGVSVSDLHPAMFPIELPAEYIKAISNKTDTITDPFLGSGTTMVAAHQLKRKCYGMEIDPVYCQIIINRMKALEPDIEVIKL